MTTGVDFRALFDAIPSPYMVLDRDLRYVAANPAYLATTKRTMDELLGQHVMDMFPNDGESGQRLHDSFKRVVSTGQADTIAYLPYDIPKPVSEGGGFDVRYWTVVHTPIVQQGQTTYVVQNTVDVTELVRLKEASTLPFRSVPGETDLLQRTREVEQRYEQTQSESANFRRLFQQAPGMIAVLTGPDHTFTFANDAYAKLVARDVTGLPIREALPDLEGQGFYEMLDEVYATGRPRSGTNIRVRLQEDANQPARTTYLDFTYDPILDAHGAVTGILVQAADRTDSVQAFQRQRVLLDELNHRVKNTLATVQSIAAQTLRDSRTPEMARQAFQARILALSHAHDLLSHSNWDGADLRSILTRELSPFGEARSSISGPAIRLPPRHTVSLGMVLHELAANAARFGALSNAEGQVGVVWDVTPPPSADQPGHLHLTWRERGGPQVNEPGRRGFGARLISMAVEGELNGRSEIRFDRSGVECDISIPYHVEGTGH